MTEQLLLHAGRLRCGPEAEPVELAPGDFAAFDGAVPHRYEALEPAWIVLIMEHR